MAATAEAVSTEHTFAWPVHPAAELFPLASAEELDDLTEDIRVNGLNEPVWLYDDPDAGATVLLDGRNRSIACARADLKAATRFYRGDDPIGFSVSQNMKRRHLTAGQKAAVYSLAYDVDPDGEEHCDECGHIVVSGDISAFRLRQLWPVQIVKHVDTLTPREWALHLVAMRDEHWRESCPKNPAPVDWSAIEGAA